MSAHRFGAALAFFALGALGCDCNPPPVKPINVCDGVAGLQDGMLAACKEHSECGDHYACVTPREKDGITCCIFSDRKCSTEADCCPGQTCPADRKKCFDRYLSCATDADCGDKGDRFCEIWKDSYCGGEGQGKCEGRCRFKTCSPLGECPEGQSCFQGECMVELPCQGTCEVGKACVPSSDRCQDYSSPTGRPQAACPVSCAPGFIGTFKDNRNLWDTCFLPDVACVCAELPVLRSEDLGRHSAIAGDAKKGQLLVSAYDGQYGDLVVYRFGADAKLQKLEWIDGVPSGTPKYGPSGPRKGVVEVGEDVGRHTDIAVSGDWAYVSYYDVTNGDLKLALRGANGVWSSFKVDGQSADLGLYSSVAVDQDGLPAISYFQRGGASDFDASSCPSPTPTGDKAFITALKLARASRPDPGPGDFSVTTLACQSRPTPACYGCNQVCADPGTGPGCYAADATCTSCDPNTETCVMVGTTPKCAKKYNPSQLADVPDGVGLFSSLAFKGKDVVIAFMKRTTAIPQGGTKPITDGDLYAVQLSAQGTAGPLVKLDGNGDTGFFPDVKVEAGGGIAVSYHDFTSRKLKFYFNTTLSSATPIEVIDSGAGPAGSGQVSFVGTDSALAFGAAPGQVYAVYQDSTQGDLKLASRTTSWKVLPPVRTEGAVGFFADAVLFNGNLYASHARIHAKLVAGEPRVDNSLMLERLPPP
ncbi:MAG: hypothetical protein HYZ28_02075 [Myxococcales bacterium]|nr:hypothetical protein [Myxococcales bacterium]